MKSRNPGYIAGDNWQVCEVCGFDYRASQLRKRWDGLMVCNSDWEPRHPQDFLKGRKERSIIARPEPADVFLPEVGNVAFSAQTYTVAEGSTATITVTRSGGSSGAVTVNYSTANGTATAGTDYTASSGTLSWADGEEGDKTFTVAASSDTANESTETVQLRLSGATVGALGAQSTALLYITNVTHIGFSSATYSGNEGDTVTITVTRTGSTAAASVQYATSDGTAIAGTDYTAASGTLTWAAGDGPNKTFTVSLSSDFVDDDAETINLTLSNASGGNLDGTTTAVLSIVNVQRTYDELLLSLSPIFYWKLNETSGTTAADSSGNGKTGTIAGSPTLANTGMQFDAVNDEVTGSTGLTIATANVAFTLIDWVKFTAGPPGGSTRRMVFGKQGTGGAGHDGAWISLGATTSSINCSMVTNDTFFEFNVNSIATNYNDGNWHMVAMKRSLSSVSAGVGKIELNIDGVSQGSANVNDSVGATDVSTFVGCDHYHNGLLRFAGFQKRASAHLTAITDSNLAALYAAGLRSNGVIP